MRASLFSLAALVALSGANLRAEEPEPSRPPAHPDVEPKAADADAPLAEGFPDATRPGQIEVKRYPAYRSAVAQGKDMTIDSGDFLFFSLFNHIQKNHVEMTAPVINTYRTPGMIADPKVRGEVSMEFVYRTLKQGEAGRDNAVVEVVDHPPGQYVCLGVQGEMDDARMRAALDRLHHGSTSGRRSGSPLVRLDGSATTVR